MADKRRMKKGSGVSHTLRRAAALLGINAKIDLAWLLRDSRTALLALLSDGVSQLCTVGSLFLLAWRFEGVGGMNQYEVLFMLGYLTLLTGVFNVFCSSNNAHISRRIGRGQVEHMFLQPVGFRLQLMTDGFIPFTGSGSLLMGALFTAFALGGLGLRVTWWWLLGLAGSVCVSFAILLCQFYLFSTAAFYAPVAAEEISSEVMGFFTGLGQYPLSGMPLGLQLPFLTLLPVGLMGWFPSMALLGKTPLGLPALYPLFVLLPLYLITRFLFRKGWNYYVKTGANRYLPYGHRG